MAPLAKEMVGEGVRFKTLYKAGMGEKEKGVWRGETQRNGGFDAKHDNETTWQYGRAFV